MSNILTRTARSYFTGIKTDYRLTAADAPQLSNIQETGLYLHIPFCKKLCPYCPYNRIMYDPKYVQPYVEAMINEIEMYHRITGPIDISSIYIGGGTPILLIDELGVILNKIRSCFNVTGDICIETSPADITNDVIHKLKEQKVTLVSVGIQTFNDKYLKFLGRDYSGNVLPAAIEKLLTANFKSVNADLMFALPNQSCQEISEDLRKTVDLGIEQVTIYPMFTFPYSTVGQYCRLKKVKLPNLVQHRRQYNLIAEFFANNGFERASIWSYKKFNVVRYSSATRDGYIGFGAGAGSHVPSGFFINTFSIDEYIGRCASGRFPTALYMPFNDLMHKYFWLYWRLYDTKVTTAQLEKKFGTDDERLKRLLKIVALLGFIKKNNGTIELNDTGAFWVHLMQNHFILDYINKVWSVGKRELWPKEIIL